MRQANLRFDGEFLEEWEVFSEAGVIDAEILSCEGDSGVTRVHVENEVDEQRLDEAETVTWWERVDTDATEHVYIYRSDVSDAVEVDTADTDTFPRAETIHPTGAGPTITCAGSQAQISAMVAAAEANGIDVTLEGLHDYRTEETALERLTARQRDVLEVAFGRGYYDVPRRASTAEVAAELGLDDSTVAEHLQRAERNVLEALLD